MTRVLCEHFLCAYSWSNHSDSAGKTVRSSVFQLIGEGSFKPGET